MEHMIEVTGFEKSYGDVKAVKGITFYAEEGKLFAFLGPNGAGKSTTINTLCTFLKPDKGEVYVNGYVLGKQDNEIRNTIGVVFQDNMLDGLLTVKENLFVRGALYEKNAKRLNNVVETVMEQTGIKDIADRKYGKLSGGQRRRCDIARALLNTPKILFLDEPTTGLDPQTRQVVWNVIRKLQNDNGMTVFLTTHYMEEAADADYVIVIDNGIIAAKGTPSELREAYASDKLVLFTKSKTEVESVLNVLGIAYSANADRITVSLENTMSSLPILEKVKQYIEGFEVNAGTMDDAFIGITGKELRQ